MAETRIITVTRQSIRDESLPAAERIKMVWPLTIEAWAMRGV